MLGTQSYARAVPDAWPAWLGAGGTTQHSSSTWALITLPFGPQAVFLQTPAARTAPRFACISHFVLEGTANICETSEGKFNVFQKHTVHTILILVFQAPLSPAPKLISSSVVEEILNCLSKRFAHVFWAHLK